MENVNTYRSDIQEIPRIRKNLSELAALWAIPASELNQIGVILEELFSNIIRFAYEDNLDHQVEIRLLREQNEIFIEIIDDGTPFNPLENRPPRISDPAASDAGGMGITLIRTFSDSLTYERKGDKNHLAIRKKIKSQV